MRVRKQASEALCDIDKRLDALKDHTLDSHIDVDAATPSDDQLLGWDSVSGMWVPKTSQAALGMVSLDYRWEAPVDTTPNQGRISTNNADPTLVTEVYIHTDDDNKVDHANFFSMLEAGNWLNIHQRNEADNYSQYDVAAPATQLNDVWTVPVVYFDSAGPVHSNGEKVELVMRFGVGSAATTFDDLDDTPADKAGNALGYVRVNAAETALEYNLIDYSEIQNPPDLTGYVDLVSDQTVGGKKRWSEQARFEGDVGIGIVPEVGLHVAQGYIGRNWPVSVTDKMLVEAFGFNYVTLVSGNTEPSVIWFADKDAQTRGNIKYDQANQTFSIRTNYIERFFFNETGVGLGDVPEVGYQLKVNGSVNLANGFNYYINGIPISTFIDAPVDGNIYGRKDAGWVQVVSGGGGTVSDLSSAPTVNDVAIQNTGGLDATIESATASLAGVMSATDKASLDLNTTHRGQSNNPHGVTLAQVGFTGDSNATKSDLSLNQTTTQAVIGNTGGLGVNILAASSIRAGVLSRDDWIRFDAMDGGVKSISQGAKGGVTVGGTATDPTVELKYTLSQDAPSGIPADGEMWFRY